MNNTKMDTSQDNFLYEALTQALAMEPEKTTPPPKTTPQKTTRKRKARQGSQYDSPIASSPLSSANPSFNLQSPTPTKGRERMSPVPVASPHIQQAPKSRVTHQPPQPQQEAGDTNTFLRQQILDTAFILYQQPLHTPLIKLASLSGIYIQPPPNPPPHPNKENPIDLTSQGTHPIPVFRSGSGNFYPQAPNTNTDTITTSTEHTYYQLTLFVDADSRIESCISFPRPGENEMIVLGRCLRDLHAKVSRQLWIRQGVIKAVRNGFEAVSVPGGSGFGVDAVRGGPIGGDIEAYARIMMGQSGMQWISRDEQEGEVPRW